MHPYKEMKYLFWSKLIPFPYSGLAQRTAIHVQHSSSHQLRGRIKKLTTQPLRD